MTGSENWQAKTPFNVPFIMCITKKLQKCFTVFAYLPEFNYLILKELGKVLNDEIVKKCILMNYGRTINF